MESKSNVMLKVTCTNIINIIKKGITLFIYFYLLNEVTVKINYLINIL
jgi:hypothetical protein